MGPVWSASDLVIAKYMFFSEARSKTLFTATSGGYLYDLKLNIPIGQTRLRTELINSEVSRVAG